MNELQTMWSISRRKSLINCPREYVLKYRNSKWIYQRFSPSDILLQQSKQLLEKDVHQMNQLVNKLGPMMNLSIIPLSNNFEYCKKCNFKDSCPAKKGLAKAKIEQVLSEYNFTKEKFDSN